MNDYRDRPPFGEPIVYRASPRRFLEILGVTLAMIACGYAVCVALGLAG